MLKDVAHRAGTGSKTMCVLRPANGPPAMHSKFNFSYLSHVVFTDGATILLVSNNLSTCKITVKTTSDGQR